MTRYKLKNGGCRKKAPFGTEEAAILSSAAINVAGTLAAANIGAKATKDAAKQQATATINAATKQANSIKEQANRARELQQESQEFTKEQNAENRELQKDIQMNLQMLTGQQNVNDRLEASKIQVRNGGSMRRKLAQQNPNTLLRGSYSQTNMPFVVTDGGGVIPLGSTPEGFDLYELYGNDHEHYHKAQGGKSKTGVGLKFANGKTIEGEGNQNSNQGEYVLVTPNDAMFISKHSIKGFNPAIAVNNGMHPLEAFVTQEQIKAANNISDSGKTPRRSLRYIGGGTSNSSDFMYLPQQIPTLSMDAMAPIATGVAYGKINEMYDKNNKNTKAKYGSSVNKKLDNSKRPKAKDGFKAASWTDWAGAGINTLGNLGGAWLTSLANNKAASTLSAANTKAAGILADAYRQMHGIDINSIRREDYAAAHAMAQLRAPIVNTAAQRTAQERTLQRKLENARRYSISGAAAQDRMTLAETDYNDNIGKIEADADRIREQIKQHNIDSINETARLNAQLDTQANNQYASAYLNALQYNNDIENQKIAGIAQAQANAITGNAQVAASTSQANAQGWGSAITNSAQAVGNSVENYIKTQTDRRNVLLGVDNEQAYRAAMSPDGSKAEARSLYNIWVNGTAEQKKWAADLNAKWHGSFKGSTKKDDTSNTIPYQYGQGSGPISLKSISNPIERRAVRLVQSNRARLANGSASIEAVSPLSSVVFNPTMNPDAFWLFNSYNR